MDEDEKGRLCKTSGKNRGLNPMCTNGMGSSLSVFYDGHHGVDVFSEAGGAEGASTGGRFLVLNHWAPTLPSVVLLPHWSHLAPYSLRL